MGSSIITPSHCQITIMIWLQGVDTENQRWSLETDLHSNSLRWNLNWEKYFWITLELGSHILNAIQNSSMVCFEEIGQKFNRMRMIWQVFSLSDGHQGNSEKPSETGKTNLKNENMLKKNFKRLRADGNKIGCAGGMESLSCASKSSLARLEGSQTSLSDGNFSNDANNNHP